MPKLPPRVTTAPRMSNTEYVRSLPRTGTAAARLARAAALFAPPTAAPRAASAPIGASGGRTRPGVLLWTGVGFVSHLATIVITVTVNVPLNNALKAAGDPDQIDLAQVRRAFDEPKWIAWNLVRVVLSLAAFGCLAVALIQHGAQS
ncbi:MAG: anthrone oxygenase family protein [Micromonosporaceae bacterium]